MIFARLPWRSHLAKPWPSSSKKRVIVWRSRSRSFRTLKLLSPTARKRGRLPLKLQARTRASVNFQLLCLLLHRKQRPARKKDKRCSRRVLYNFMQLRQLVRLSARLLPNIRSAVMVAAGARRARRTTPGARAEAKGGVKSRVKARVKTRLATRIATMRPS